MKEMTKTVWLATAVAALLAIAALLCLLFPGILQSQGLDDGDLGEGALVAVILFLALRRQKPMAPGVRLVLGVAVAVGLLLGLAVFSMA